MGSIGMAQRKRGRGEKAPGFYIDRNGAHDRNLRGAYGERVARAQHPNSPFYADEDLLSSAAAGQKTNRDFQRSALRTFCAIRAGRWVKKLRSIPRH